MPATQILVDTSFLYAIYNLDDYLHKRAIVGIDADADLIIPQVVLVEVAYLLKDRSGVPATLKFLEGIIASQTPLEAITSPDLIRVHEIMASYASAKFDFVDCCIMALSERLNITRIYTFDRRDFSIFRPKHIPNLELLP